MTSTTVQKSAYLALAKQMVAQRQLLAKRLHLYSLYMAIDSAKLSTSMIKYFFDISLADTDLSAKAMQEWIRTPVGTTTVALSAINFIVFSMLARHFDDGDKTIFKPFIITSWPVARELMKTSRNVYRGVSSTLTLLQLLDIQDLRHLIVPASLLLGALSMLNRVWSRYMSNQYNEMIKVNIDLLAEIKTAQELTQSQINEIRSKIKEQSSQLRVLSLLSSGFSGMVEGINPYIGILVASTLTPPMLTAISIFCGVYFLATFAMRIYDEINLQREIYIVQNKVELALLAKEIHFLTTQLENIPTREECYANLRSKYLEHQKIAEALLSTGTDTPALITGVKNGLATYKYIMLTISMFLFLSPIRLIPTLPAINRAILGTSALVGFSLYSLIPKNKTKQKENQLEISLVHPFLQQGLQVKASLHQNIKLTGKEFNAPPENFPEKTQSIKRNSQVKNPNMFFSYKEEYALSDRGTACSNVF